MSYPGYPPSMPSGMPYPPAAPQGYPPAAQPGYAPVAPQGYPPVSPQGYPLMASQGYPPTAPQGYPPNQQYPGGYGQWPVAPPPKRRISGPVIGLIAAVGLIIIGLLVWLVILPATRGGGTDDPNVMRAAVVRITPNGWSDPLELTGFADNGVSVVDTMVGDVVAASDGNVLAAIDLKTRNILWSADMKIERLVADEIGNIVVVEKDTHLLSVLDALTGRVKGTLQMKDTESNTVALAGIVLTVDSKDKRLCARDEASLDVCKWSAKQNARAGFVFGNYEWFNTNDGVVEWKTGRPAPFGADSGASSDGNHFVSYTIYGVPEQVVRVEGDRTDANSDWSYTVQPWDKNKDKASGSPISTSKYYWVPGPLIVTMSDDNHTAKAYSKTSGALLWTFDSGGKTLKNGMLVGNYVSFNDDEYGFFAIDAKTGQQKFWAGGDTHYYRVSQYVGTQILYAVNITHNQLCAYDGKSASFAQLWTVPLPSISNKLEIYNDANHVYAIKTDVSPPQLWVLNS